MPDANKENTINQLVGAAFGAAGQRCMALSTAIFVGESRNWLPELVERSRSLRVNAGICANAHLHFKQNLFLLFHFSHPFFFLCKIENIYAYAVLKVISQAQMWDPWSLLKPKREWSVWFSLVWKKVPKCCWMGGMSKSRDMKMETLLGQLSWAKLWWDL